LSNTTNNKSEKGVFIYLSIFFTTMSLFVYETLLTRLFSTILSQGLVFIVISFAILGGGIGSILTYKIYAKKKIEDKALLYSSIILPLSFIASISLMYFLPFVPFFIIYIPAAIFPFIIGGIITSIIFMKKFNCSNKLYLMDLLGSGLGSLIIIKLMNSFGFLRSVVIVCIIATIASIAMGFYYKKTKSLVYSSMILFSMSLLISNNGIIEIMENNFHAYYSSPVKMIKSYNEADLKAKIIYTKWDSISRTDVLDVEGRDDKFIVTDGGAAAPIKKFNGDLNSVKDMKLDANYIPFAFGTNEKSLVIGSGGGNDVLYALLGGNKQVDAVEINPSTIEAVNKLKDYSGDIYNFPGVNLYIQDGRYFINNSTEKYDNIYLSKVMTNSVQNTMYSLAEYYIFTEEAVNEYFNHLTENGKLTFVAHNINDLTKIVNTGIKVLIDRGIDEKDVNKYFTIINGMTNDQSSVHGDGIAMPVVIFKNVPLSYSEIESIMTFAYMQNRDMIQIPGNEIEPYKSLSSGDINFKNLLTSFNYNADPITDDSPFFYNYSKYIPINMIAIVVLIAAIASSLLKKYLLNVEYKKASFYFGALGMGFMLVEVPLIQKMVLYFGSSSLAFSFVVYSLLISSGIGSLISGTNITEKISNKSPLYALFAGIVIIIIQLALDFILNYTMGFTLINKFFILFLTVFPMGFFMGMAYPSGIKIIGNLNDEDNIVPLMVAVNGIFSVLGSTLAVVLSMMFGFSITLYIGAAVYIIIFIINPLKVFKLY